MPDCLICGRQTAATHLGMDACRACTVFFRRHRTSREKLRCMNGKENCNDFRMGSYTCRKCRMDRFDDVMASGKTGQQNQNVDQETTTPSPCSSAGLPVEIPNRVSLDFNAALQGSSTMNDSSPTTPSIIDKIRSNYQTLSTMRRAAEFQLRGIVQDPFEADREEYEIVPCTYKIMNEATRVLIIGLFDFIPAIFPEFGALPLADKWLLIRNYQKIFYALDSCLRSKRRWGNDIEVHFGSYTTYLSVDAVDVFFRDCPDQKNVADAARTLRDCIQENCIPMQKQLSRMLITDEEHFALMGIAFWSVENIEPSDALMELASRYRTEILSDLTSRYRQTIGLEKGTSRIGGMYSVLLHLKSAELNLKWEYEIYRILNVFDDNTYMYRMQLHRADIES